MTSNYYKASFNRVSEEKRSKILMSAIAEFADNGFNGANINTIAEKAGISVGSLYKYFGSKENLYLTVINYGVEIIKTVLEEIMNSEEDLISRIEKIIKAIQSYSRSNAHLTRLYNEMATESNSELVWRIASDMENATAGLYASLIKEAQEAGIVRNDIDASLFAFFLDNLFMLLQFSYACEYYKERMKIFVGADVFDHDELVAEQLMKFIKGAFLLNG